MIPPIRSGGKPLGLVERLPNTIGDFPKMDILSLDRSPDVGRCSSSASASTGQDAGY
jgi:hypothetical protein